jgi:hypothetical protein
VRPLHAVDRKTTSSAARRVIGTVNRVSFSIARSVMRVVFRAKHVAVGWASTCDAQGSMRPAGMEERQTMA